MNTEQEQYSIKLKELIAQGYKIFSVYSLDKTEALDACMCVVVLLRKIIFI